MIKDDNIFLLHIFDETKFILETTGELSKEEFLNSRLIQGSMKNSLMVIGEASKNISEKFIEENSEIPWRMMAATRDRFIHGYFSVDPNRIWIILTEDIPKLYEQLSLYVKK